MSHMIKLAHAVLKDTGFLAISINQMELFNLKPLLDTVFGDDRFVGIFPVKIRHRERQLMINATSQHEFDSYRCDSASLDESHGIPAVDKSDHIFVGKAMPLPQRVKLSNSSNVVSGRIE